MPESRNGIHCIWGPNAVVDHWQMFPCFFFLSFSPFSVHPKVTQRACAAGILLLWYKGHEMNKKSIILAGEEHQCLLTTHDPPLMSSYYSAVLLLNLLTEVTKDYPSFIACFPCHIHFSNYIWCSDYGIHNKRPWNIGCPYLNAYYRGSRD